MISGHRSTATSRSHRSRPPHAARSALSSKGDTLHYRLTIRDFSEDPLFAHIHFARPDVNGGVIAFLCGGGGKPVCPRNGTVTGTITAADVVGPGRGIDRRRVRRADQGDAQRRDVRQRPHQHVPARRDPRQHQDRLNSTEPSRRAGRPARVARLSAFFAAVRVRCGLPPDVRPIDLDRTSPHGRHDAGPDRRGDHGRDNRC